MPFLIQASSAEPIYRQIVEQVRRHVASGQWKAGDELPSVRAVAQEHAGECDASCFAAGQAETTFADHGVQPLRQSLREAHHLRGFGGGVQLFVGGLWIGHAQVVGDAAVEQVGTLRGVADAKVVAYRQASRARL